MSPTVEIVDLTKKIDSQLKERVLDPDRPVKELDDVIELGMYNAYQLSDHDDFKFLEGLRDVEIKLGENKQFVEYARQMDKIRQGLDIPELPKIPSGLKLDLPELPDAFKSLVDGQNKLREQFLKISQPSVEFSDAIQRLTQITQTHQRYNIEEQERMQLEVAKSEMDMHSVELERATLLVKKADAVYVSGFYKQHEKDIQPHIIRNKTKDSVDGGVSKKQQAMLDDIYKMWIKYSSMMKGKLLKEDLFDTRKRRYSNEECYNFIRAKYPKLENSTIEEYIRKYPKK